MIRVARVPGRGRDEDGAYLVMYALLAVAFFTMAAVVLDIAALRQGRRADRTAADLAVTAGVTELVSNDPFSFAGTCEAAWGYVLANRTQAAGTISAPDCVATFPSAVSCDPTLARTATGSVGPITVEITHPVPDSSPLMLAEAQAGDIPQTVAPASDGAPCERLAVRIVRSRTFLFGQIAGVLGGSTDVHSVARALSTTSTTEVPAVVVLEPTACNALVTDGLGGNLELGGAGLAGLAVVDSAASWCGGAFAIDPGPDGIQALAAGPVSPQIRSFALSQSTFASAYDPNDLGSGILAPTPTPALTRTGRALVDSRYRCPACVPPRDPIGQLEAERNVAGAPAGSTPFATCTVPAGPPVVVSGFAHVYVDCDDLIVDGSVTFLGQSVTVKGNIRIGAGACVAVNDATCGAAGIPPGDADVFVRGSLVKDVKGQLALANTFLYTGGTLDIGVDPDTLVGNSYLAWTAPVAGGFEDLLFWSESAGPMVLGEQKSVTLVGTFAAPNAAVVLNARAAAGGVTSQLQVVSRTLRLSGDGTYRLQPATGRATGALTRQVRLIR